MTIYEQLGFDRHPFATTNADEEPNLSEYFVPPPFFDAVVGDPSTPSSSVILAPRGAGKTAQRRMVEDCSMKKQFMAVTYDRFEFSGDEKVTDIQLQYHLRNIITRILVTLLSYLKEYPAVIKSLSKTEKRELALFVKTYLGTLTGNGLQVLMSELRSIPEKIKNFWKDNVGFMESVLNFVLKSYELEKIDIPDVKNEEKKLSETYKYQLEYLLKIAQQIGYKSIYVLIDKVDETEQTGNDSDLTYRLIQPLVKDLELLGLRGYGFKFFLWDKVQALYRKDARPDRIPQYHLKWSRSTLRNVLSARLRAFSSGQISSLSQIVESNKVSVDDLVCVFSNGSPRNLIRLCEKIMAAHNSSAVAGGKISLESLEKGVLAYSEMLFLEVYGETLMKDMQRIGRELFTTNHIANDILKISGQGARNKITSWANVGIIKQLGTVSIESSKKPINFYSMVDPFVIRMLHRTTGIEEFFQDRWLPCSECEADNLFNIDLFPEGNDPLCKDCGRNLL